MAQGLKLLHGIFKITDHGALVSAIEDFRRLWEEPSFFGKYYEGVLSPDKQGDRSTYTICERDERERMQDPLPFQGDNVVDPDGKYPSLGWTLYWKGLYGNKFAEAIDGGMAGWGYVMWDSKRIERSSVKDLLKRQSESGRRGRDERMQWSLVDHERLATFIRREEFGGEY